MSTDIKQQVLEAIKTDEITTEDFPFDFIMRLFMRIREPIIGVDADICDCAIRYFDAKFDRDRVGVEEAWEDLGKLLES